ncbi:MAG: hypothetical protein ACI8V2_002716 [Candidatus Latescibacterota bacterium]|jgi:hypothetical protein
MKKAILTLAIGLSFIIGSAQAQEDTQLKLAEKLLTVMELQKTIEQSFAAVTKMIPGQDNPSATDKRVLDMIMQELSWDTIKHGYITLYADLFTEKELKDLTAFYESPVGQAFVKKQPELTQRSMMLSQQMMMKIIPKLQGMGR